MFCLDYSRDHRKTILIAGSGRSGTTWISNLLNYKNEYRDVFEPFHRQHVPLALTFPYNVYLRPEERNPEMWGAAHTIVSGGLQNAWTNRNNRRRIAGRRLVKEICIHHMLKWLAVQFPGMPIVFILRHPLAVVESRRALRWPARLDFYLERPKLIEDFLAPFVPEIEQVSRLSELSFERNVYFWCIENYVPLQQFRAGEIHLAFYENFVTDPIAETQRLFAFLGKPYEPRVLNALGIPSSQTRSDSHVHMDNTKLDRWQQTFSLEQIAWANQILERFGLDRFYTDELTPRRDTTYLAAA